MHFYYLSYINFHQDILYLSCVIIWNLISTTVSLVGKFHNVLCDMRLKILELIVAEISLVFCTKKNVN